MINNIVNSSYYASTLTEAHIATTQTQNSTHQDLPGPTPDGPHTRVNPNNSECPLFHPLLNKTDPLLPLPHSKTKPTTTGMLRYPYDINVDPNADLVSAFYCSAGPAIGQPIANCPPLFFEGAFPASSSLPSSNDYFTHQMPSFSSSSSASDFLDFHGPEPVRRVYSTGDLQVSAENCAVREGAVSARVGQYSAEERKERIERYRSKRNQRNFHKKITYACRKTLADSRPRVRGRFARNGETEAENEAESSEASFECYGHGACDNGGSYNNFGCSTAGGGDLLKQMQAALAATDEEEECCYDDNMWASLDTVFSMNLLS